MKKLILAVVALTTVSFTAPKKAEAGLLFALTGNTYTASVVICTSAVVTLITRDNYYLWVGLVLDTNGSVSKDQLVNGLRTKYNFIENQDAIAALATTIQTNANSVPFVDGKKIVRINREELNTALQSADLTGYQAEIEQMAKDLE